MTRELLDATRAGLETAIRLRIAAIDARFRPDLSTPSHPVIRAIALEARAQEVDVATAELRAAYARLADPII